MATVILGLFVADCANNTRPVSEAEYSVLRFAKDDPSSIFFHMAITDTEQR
jgi:hypothetical protein